MVTKYEPITIYDPIGDMDIAHCVVDDHGTYVLAADCAAIEADRDEWKRRCEALTTLASDCDPSLNRYYLVACKCGWKGSSSECDGGTPLADTGDYDDVKCPVCGAVDPTDMQARALAIAEGRDNG